jgi:hypothetical protein
MGPSNKRISGLLAKGDKLMKRNMSNLDRIFRVILAVVFAYLYFSGVVAGVFGVILLALGAIFLLTSLFSFCPLYVPFKFSTLRK